MCNKVFVLGLHLAIMSLCICVRISPLTITEKVTVNKFRYMQNATANQTGSLNQVLFISVMICSFPTVTVFFSR